MACASHDFDCSSCIDCNPVPSLEGFPLNGPAFRQPPVVEVRTVSASGGEKGVKLARYDLMPVGPLKQVAEHYGKGAEKYDAHNWRRGYEWSKSYAALQRHAAQFWGGEDIDEETGSHHMAAVVFHALALLEFAESHPDYDDRFRASLPESVTNHANKLLSRLCDE